MQTNQGFRQSDCLTPFVFNITLKKVIKELQIDIRGSILNKTTRLCRRHCNSKDNQRTCPCKLQNIERENKGSEYKDKHRLGKSNENLKRREVWPELNNWRG